VLGEELYSLHGELETVTYVANIYKHYAAYKLVAEEQEERNKALKQSQTTPTH